MMSPSRTDFLKGPPGPLALVLPQPPVEVFELYRRLSRSDKPSFLLESGRGNSTTARYSFMGNDPYLILTGGHDSTTIEKDGRTEVIPQAAFSYLSKLMLDSVISLPPDLPPFYGGAVGYLSYDWARSLETIPSLATDDVGLPHIQFAFMDLVVAVDHQSHRLYLIFCPPLSRFRAEPREKVYREGVDRLAELEARLAIPADPVQRVENTNRMLFTPDQSRLSYTDRVRRCQEYIAAGDIYQANISHRFTLDRGTAVKSLLNDPVSSLRYHHLRAVNPSPFAGLLCFENVCLVSSSPERLISLRGRRAETRPIAGTRPRGRTPDEDRRLIFELLGNEKERAEHLMLVDLERNDLGRVCDYGSVRVTDFMATEQYSHVSHIVSNVSGILRHGITRFELIKAVFPGGTITGVPKVRCMEIIEELEPTRRGPYTGALGYLSWSGDLDFNILIRTLVMTKARSYLQVGAGIVADSQPDREYEETLHKAEACFKALGRPA